MIADTGISSDQTVDRSWVPSESTALGQTPVPVNPSLLAKASGFPSLEGLTQSTLHQYRTVIDAVPALIFFKDAHNRIITANRAAATSLGLTVETMQGVSTYDLYPDEAARYHQDDLDVICSGKPKYGIVEPYRDKTGQKHWMKTDKVPYSDEQGNIVGVVVFSVDLTDTIEAKEIIEQSEAKYRQIVETAMEGIVVLDKTHRLTFVNQRFAEMTGYEVHELLGRSMVELTISCQTSQIETALSRRRRGLKEIYETQLLRKDGQPLWVMIAANPLGNSEGNYQGCLKMITDITERKRMEESIQETLAREKVIRHIVELISHSFDVHTILSQMAHEIGTYFKADRCVILRYCRDGEDTTIDVSSQYRSSEQLPLIPNSDVPNVVKPLCPPGLTETFSSVYLNESNMARMTENDPTGVWRHFCEKYRIQSALVLEIFYRGQLYGKIALHQCFSQRQWQDSEVQFLQDIAVHVANALFQAESYQAEQEDKHRIEVENERKRTFISNLSHEFKTPLHAILGFSQILQEQESQNLTSKQNKYLTNIMLSAEHMLRMVQDLLDISRIEAGRIELYREYIYLDMMSQEIANLFDQMARCHSVSLNFQVPPDMPPIYADPNRFRQILFNLLSNAIKYNKPGGSVNVSFAQSEAGILVAEIEDTGIGIPKNRQQELFTEFCHLATEARSPESTGLGLALTKKLIELQGGSIHITSTEGIGTRVSFTLPCAGPLQSGEVKKTV